MNLIAPRHSSRLALIAVVGTLSLAAAGIAPYAVAEDHGPDQRVERRAIPERRPVQRAPVGRASAPRFAPIPRRQEPIAHQYGPFINRGPAAQPRGPQVVNHGPVERAHGPFESGPVVHGHGPIAINRTPLAERHGPVILNRGPAAEQRGPLVTERREPERFENHGSRDFRDHPADRDHDFFDDRYDHGRYYPRRGEFVRELPDGYRPFYFHRRPFYFIGGVWYVNGPGGYIVAGPPVGLVVSILPPFYTSVWLGGVQYFYADDVYYQRDPEDDAYVVVTPPTVDEDAAAAPPEAQPAADQDQLYIYPENGQSEQQQAQDRYDCYSWAKSQTGFDSTQPGGGVPPDQSAEKNQQYRRAMTACLTARGYSVD